MIKPPQEFYVNEGLYSEIELVQEDKNALYDLLYGNQTIDCYCITCEKESVFGPVENRPQFMNAGILYPTRNPNDWDINLLSSKIGETKIFECSRNAEHKLIFNLLINEGKFQKIGQFPSIKDINISEIRQYKTILQNEFFVEYSTAIGLHSHGVGIGSFVYLRRIVENFIIKPAHEIAKRETTWNEEEFQRKRMKERIEMLRNYLPEYLVETREVYSIISKGIHELTELECREYFPVISSVLNFILSELKEKAQTEKQKQELKIKLQEIGGKLK